MRNYDASGAVGDGVSKDFAWVYEAGGQRADGYDAFGNQSIGAIEREANEVINLPYILHTFTKLGRSESEIQEDDRKAVTRVWCEDSFGVVSESK